MRFKFTKKENRCGTKYGGDLWVGRVGPAGSGKGLYMRLSAGVLERLQWMPGETRLRVEYESADPAHWIIAALPMSAADGLKLVSSVRGPAMRYGVCGYFKVKVPEEVTDAVLAGREWMRAKLWKFEGSTAMFLVDAQ